MRNTTVLSTTRYAVSQTQPTKMIGLTLFFTDQRCMQITAATHRFFPLILYFAYVVCRGRCKSLIGQHDTETTAGQTQQLGRVVSNGCDVVGVARRQCRQHEWMVKHQWRLSFSCTSENCTHKQLDAGTTNCLSFVTFSCKDRAID